VKLIKCPDGSLAACKIYKTEGKKFLEYNVMRQLISPWILKAEEYKENGSINLPAKNPSTAEGENSYFSLRDQKFSYIILELAENGDLFDYLEIGGFMCETIARYYLKCLVSSIECMHAKGIAHRDIKPENILLTKDFSIKLADFGLSVSADRDGKFVGTYG
jgi:serine/threonine protein kinase